MRTILLTIALLSSGQTVIPRTPPVAGGASSTGASLVGEHDVALHRMVRVRVANPLPECAYLWDVTPDVVDLEDLGHSIVFTGPRGDYVVKLTVLTPKQGGGFEKQLLRWPVTIGATGAGPPAATTLPAPAPGSGPGGGGIAPGPRYIVVVEESAAVIAANGALYGGAALQARVVQMGHHWRIVPMNATGPDGQPPVDVARFLVDAREKAGPQIYFVDARGVVILKGDRPTTAAGILAMLTQAGG